MIWKRARYGVVGGGGQAVGGPSVSRISRARASGSQGFIKERSKPAARASRPAEASLISAIMRASFVRASWRSRLAKSTREAPESRSSMTIRSA